MNPLPNNVIAFRLADLPPIQPDPPMEDFAHCPLCAFVVEMREEATRQIEQAEHDERERFAEDGHE